VTAHVRTVFYLLCKSEKT